MRIKLSIGYNKLEYKKIILGTAQFGLDYGISNSEGRPHKLEVFEILNSAYSNGITILDTAEAYGNAHSLIGDFHELYPERTFLINTKLPKGKILEIDLKVTTYLNELKINQIQTLFFHSYESFLLNQESLTDLIKLKNNNKIKLIGVSVYENDHAIAIAKNKEIDVIQIPFNIFDNLNHRGEVLKIAKKNGKIVQTRSVFLQGLFFMSPYINNSIVQKLRKELLLLEALSKEKKINIENVALNYALFQKKIDLVLVGVNSINELDDMLKSINSNKINFEILDVINSINILNKNLLNPSNWI